VSFLPKRSTSSPSGCDTAGPFYQGRDFGNSGYAAEKSAFDLTSRFSLKKRS
jgi:hypothetical protein